MNCSSSPLRTVTYGPKTVFSTGATAPGESSVFVMSPESLLEIAPLLVGVRATVYVENATTGLYTEVVFQSTNDDDTWTTFSLETAGAVAGNRKVTLAWSSNVSNFLRGIRFGVKASQNAGVNVVQLGQVTLIVDLLLRS